jgi:hypothetical protein
MVVHIDVLRLDYHHGCIRIGAYGSGYTLKSTVSPNTQTAYAYGLEHNGRLGWVLVSRSQRRICR